MENPSSPAGRLGTAILTSRTAAVRRALNRPISVTSATPSSTTSAERSAKPAGSWPISTSTAITSARSSANTARLEKIPISISPLQPSQRQRSPEARNPSGSNAQDAASKPQARTRPGSSSGR